MGFVPTGGEAFGFAAGLDRLALTEQMERDAAQDGEVFGRMPEADAAVILPEGGVECPMELIFDAPMAAGGPRRGDRHRPAGWRGRCAFRAWSSRGWAVRR